MNGTWVVQQVDAQLLPLMPTLSYTVTVISVAQVQTSIDFWTGLAK